MTFRLAAVARCVAWNLAWCIAPFLPAAAGQSWSTHLSVGLSSATYVGESDNDFGYRHTLTGGAGVAARVTDVLGVRAEVLYVIRGGVAENAVIDGEATDLTARFSVAYVDIPLLLVARVPGARFAPYVFGGGSYGWNVEAQLTLISPSNTKIQEEDDSIAKHDLALVGGVGVTFPIAAQSFFVEARFTGGLSNVRPDRPDAPLRNRSFLVVAGFRF